MLFYFTLLSIFISARSINRELRNAYNKISSSWGFAHISQGISHRACPSSAPFTASTWSSKSHTRKFNISASLARSPVPNRKLVYPLEIRVGGSKRGIILFVRNHFSLRGISLSLSPSQYEWNFIWVVIWTRAVSTRGRWLIGAMARRRLRVYRSTYGAQGFYIQMRPQDLTVASCARKLAQPMTDSVSVSELINCPAATVHRRRQRCYF